jgi:two-component system LytT family response regulator
MTLARKRVRRYLNPDAEIEIVGECANGHDALTTIPELKPDLIFLDVQMPGMSGFEVLQNLSGEDVPGVIFVTAYDEFALQAFEVNALDYLLKPFIRDRFYKALTRAKAQIKQQKSAVSSGDPHLHNFLKQLKSESNHLKRLVVKSNGRVIFLLTDEIDSIEAAGNYLSVRIGKESHLIRETLSQIEQKLDPGKFVRINRSVIINLDRIKEMHPLFSGDQEIILRSEKRFTMSRNYRDKLFAALNL